MRATDREGGEGGKEMVGCCCLPSWRGEAGGREGGEGRQGGRGEAPASSSFPSPLSCSSTVMVCGGRGPAPPFQQQLRSY